MAQKIPEFIRSDMVKLFEKPQKHYLKFSKAIRQDVETKSFKTFTSRLNCFIDLLCSEDISKETATMKIEEFVNQGMVEIMLWDAFVNLISQPVSPTITSAIVALLQTLQNIVDNSISTAKAQVCVFLPYLVRDVIGNEKNEHRLRIEGTKLINNLLEKNPIELRVQTEKLKSQRTIHDDVGALIINAADFELQAQLLEMVFRLFPETERVEYVYFWFESEDLQTFFLCIEDKSFEPGCRKFLNKLNENRKGVFSIPCQMVLFGSQQIPIAKDVETGNHWLDFNLGSKTLKFFFEEKEETPSENEDDDIWWRTVTVELDNVDDCNLFEHQDCILLKITLKENVTSIIPSWSPSDIHVINIKFGLDCGVHKLREVLERFSWIRPDRFSSSPKASVAIFSVHLADRQKGQMTVVPTIDSMPPEALMEEDSIEGEVPVNNSNVTASLDSKGIEESEELLPVEDKPQEELENTQATSTQSQDYTEEKTVDLEPTDSQEVKADYSSSGANDNVGQMSLRSSNVKAIKENQLDQNQPGIDKQDMGQITTPVVENNDLNEAEDTIKDKTTEENVGNEIQKRRTRDQTKEISTSTPSKKKSRSNDDSGTESSSSRRSSRRSSRERANSKRTKSPLPVEIIKSDRRKSSSTSGKSSTDSENEKESPEPKKPKTYPSAFNVDKRMQAKKNNLLANNSQEIKKKVFGQTGSSFVQKAALHIMAPARRTDHFKKRKSPPLQDKQSSKKHSRDKDTRTKEPALELSDPDHTSQDDDAKEVIQDSLPLDNSPEVVPRPRRRSDVPKATETKISDKRLTQSESSTRTKQRVQFVNDKTIPTRLGTILRKGDKKDRDSLLEESQRSGWGSTSTSSTSETDWPGPDVEPGPKEKHSLVPCKSVREDRPPRNTASQQGRKKRASVSPGLSAISEEKSPVEIQLDDDTPQATRARDQDKPVKTSDRRTKKQGREVAGLGDNEKAPESGNTSEDTLLYGATSDRKPKKDVKTSDKSKALRSKKVDTAKQHNKHSTSTTASNKTKKHEKIDFEQEFDLDLPDLTLLAVEDYLVGGKKVGQESAVLSSNRMSLEDHHQSRDKSASDEKGIPLDNDNDEEIYTQDYTTAKSRKTTQDTSRARAGVRKRVEEDFDGVFYQEDSTDKKKSKSFESSHSKLDDSKQLRRRLFKRGLSEDEPDEESDLPNEYKSPKRRKTYGKKQRQKHSSTLVEDWMKDKDTENKTRTSDVSRMGWQSSRKGASKSSAQKSLSGLSNRSDEELQSGYESDNPPACDQRHKEAYLNERQEKRNPRSRKTKGEQQEGGEQPKSHSKPKNRNEDMDYDIQEINDVPNSRNRKTKGEQQGREQRKSHSKPKNRVEDIEEEEETNEVLNLRRFCQDITTSTPAPEHPLRKRRDEENEDGKPTKRIRGSKIQGKSNGLISDQSGKASPKHSKHHGENEENFAGHNVPRSRANTNEKFGPRQVNASKYETPSTNQVRLNDSGLGRSIGTGSRRRTSVSSSTASTTPKARQKGELRVTTSISKTPVTPRTSAIMRRIDEEEDFAHSKKPRQVFVDWTSSGPSRTVSTPYQEPYSPEVNIDDHRDREHKRAHEHLKGNGDHNPNIRPRQLFRQVVNEPSPEEDLEDEMHYDQSSVYEDTRDISDILSNLSGNLTERLRRKRQNLQRFCKRTMDVTIETINRHFEQNLSNRDKVIDAFNDQFLEEIKTLKDEMEKAKKTEEQILARIEEDIKTLKTRRILQENKIKGLRNLCVEFQSEMIKGSDSQSDNQDAFQDEIRQELVHIQEHFLVEAQRQDRENLRRSLRSVLDATMV